MLDKLLFHSKHWQLFIIASGVLLLDTALDIRLYGIVWIMYLAILGMRLKSFLPAHYQAAYNGFLIASAVCLVTGFYRLLIVPREADMPTRIVSVIAGVSLVVMTSFVARSIKCLETRDRATINDYFVDIILLVLFFPLGVWFIQPRLNLLGGQFFR